MLVAELGSSLEVAGAHGSGTRTALVNGGEAGAGAGWVSRGQGTACTCLGSAALGAQPRGTSPYSGGCNSSEACASVILRGAGAWTTVRARGREGVAGDRSERKQVRSVEGGEGPERPGGTRTCLPWRPPYPSPVTCNPQTGGGRFIKLRRLPEQQLARPRVLLETWRSGQ